MKIKDFKKANTADDRTKVFGRVSSDLAHYLTGERLGTLNSPSYYDPSTADKFTYIPLTREYIVPGVYDDFYKRIQQINRQSKRDELLRQVRLIHKSEIFHELSHDAITQQEHQFYLEPKVQSFEITILYYSNTNNHRLVPVISQLAESVSATELVQEAYAIRRQRRFLRQQPASSFLSEILQEFNYQSSIGDFLESGEPVGTYIETLNNDHGTADVLRYPSHTFADWLNKRAAETWEIDVLDYAFRIQGAILNQSNFGEQFPDQPLHLPDEVFKSSVLLAIQPGNTPIVHECAPDQQPELLTEFLANYIQDAGDQQWHKSSSLLGQQKHTGVLQVRNRRDAAFSRRMVKERSARDRNLDYLLPLLSADYPGTQIDNPLWSILDGMYTVVEENGERSLYIEREVYDWAMRTRLLDIAIELWNAREELFMPIFQLFNTNIAYSPHDILTMAGHKTIQDPSSEFPDSDHITMFLDDIDAKKGAYEDLYETMKSIGKAIRDEDTAKIRAFI